MSKVVFGKELFTKLKEIVSPQHTALVIVDLQNDFCSPGGFFDQSKLLDSGPIKSCINQLSRLLAEARKLNEMIVFIQHTNYARDVFKAAPDLARKIEYWSPDSSFMSVEGTWGHKIVDELRPLAGEIIIQKHRHNSFMGTSLDMMLRSNGIKTVIVTGTATEICVLATVTGAIAHDYYVVVPRDCVVTASADLNEAALKVISSNLSKEEMTDSRDIIKVWQGDNK